MSAAQKEIRATADGGDDAAGPETAQIRALRIAVIVMSLLLIIGFITVIARIIYLASKPAAQASALATPGAALAPDIVLELPKGAILTGTSLAGNRLAVTFSAPSGPGIAVLDLETGRVLSRDKLAPDSGQPGR